MSESKFNVEEADEVFDEVIENLSIVNRPETEQERVENDLADLLKIIQFKFFEGISFSDPTAVSTTEIPVPLSGELDALTNKGLILSEKVANHNPEYRQKYQDDIDEILEQIRSL